MGEREGEENCRKGAEKAEGGYEEWEMAERER